MIEVSAKSIRTVNVWVAHGDGGERGLGPIIGIFSEEHLAEIHAKGKGWYGSDGQVLRRKALEIESRSGKEYYLLDPSYTSVIDINNLEHQRKEKRKEELLSKMSEEDKQILGIK